MNPATDCPSRKMGLCQAGNKCYALKAEKQYYKTCLPFRRRQAVAWGILSARGIAIQLLSASWRARKHKMLEFRFSEAGDFRSQTDVDKMVELCRILSNSGVICYGYTARTDLDLSKLLKVAGVNVSNGLNRWINRGANRFQLVQHHTGKNPVCGGDCSLCNLCKHSCKRLVEIVEH